MSVLNTGLAKTSAAAGGYSVDNSLRFNDDDSAYLSRTPSSAGNRKTWTWSGWVKRGNVTTEQYFWGALGSGDADGISFTGADELQLVIHGGSGGNLKTKAKYRDPSAWYHIVVAVDTTQSTSSDRVKMYVNGSQITEWFSTAYDNYPSLNYDTDTNTTNRHDIGEFSWSGGMHYDGYLAEVHFIDGQALDPTSFGETGTYGEWKPIAVTGMTYGTNGFYLDFKVAGTGTTGAGKDVSGEGNNWSTSGIASTDQMLDSPTNNFCTMNPISRYGGTVLSEGNLKVNNGSQGRVEANMAFPSTGKYYMEIDTISISAVNWNYAAIALRHATGSYSTSYSYGGGGTNYVLANLYHRSDYGDIGTRANYWVNTNVAAGGDIFQIAYDADNSKIYLGKNNTWYGSSDPSAGTGTAWLDGGFGNDGMIFYGPGHVSYTYIANFGQDSSFAGNKTAQGNQDSNSIGDFYYTPPTDFLALCTSNLSDPAVIPSEHFNTVLYTGNSSTNAITGVGFQPDFVWAKARSSAQSSRLVDAVRGTSNILNSDLTDVEYTGASYSFDSDGFTWSGGGGNANDNAVTYAAWNWKANGTGVSNTNGSITSTVSANADAGFSIVSYTGTGSNATVGHGLSVTPEMVIVTNRNYVSNWACLHSGIASDYETDYIPLNNATTSWDNNAYWNDTKPTNSLFSVGTDNDVNRSGDAHIAYCFHSVAQYSKVFSYTGNGSTDGTFVYCDFRPKYVMIKKLTGSYSWYIYDTSRNTYNVVGEYLFADSSSAEASATHLDILSNGFKIRTITNALNNNLNGYIGIAFAELPAKYNNAR